MKKIIYIFAIILPLIWVSCDTIEEDQQLIYLKGITTETTPITAISSEQKVLLEDYTGWKCVNCPRAAAKATEMISKYGEKLVVMAVHATAFANNSIDSLNFKTEYGERWATEFGCTSLPTGVINRRKIGGAYTIGDANWDSEIQNTINSQKHIMDINLGVKYKEEYNKILVSTENIFREDYPSKTQISVLVLESGIIGVQYNTDPNYGTTPKINDFEFNHILRKNGLIDYPLTTDKVNKGEKIAINYLIDVDPDIQDISKCAVVVFVTDAQTKEVIQVNEIHL